MNQLQLRTSKLQMNKHLLFVHICHFLELLGPYKEGYQQIESEDFQYDFKDRRIQINSYTIKSANRGDRIKSWKIEISDDGNSWRKIDERNDVTELNAENKTKFIFIQMSQPFRFLRLITDQCSFRNCTDVAIGKLEFFGNIL